MQEHLHALGVRGLVSAIKGKLTKTPVLLQVNRPDIRFPFFLRTPPDVSIFEQIFCRQEYQFDVKRTPGIIVDAGANIGLASIYFSNKFPDARIIAIEPEESNLEILGKNIAPYANIISHRGALWHENTKLDIVDPGVGKCGLMTQAQDGMEKRYGKFVQEVQGVTVDTIMKEYGIDRIDILKIDIEGAEREVFRDSSSWIGKVDALIIELHERLKPGCNRSFYNGSNGFDNEWSRGENLFLTRG
jgi:FkbM family methyltransferase